MAALAMFPLGTVLFPHMVLPLHIFEPRYRTLIQDVLAAEGEFGVTLITRGPEVGGGDQRASIGTVARVLQAEELDDGRWLAITIGTRRFEVGSWLDDAPYPRASVIGLPEPEVTTRDAAMLDRLVPKVRRVLALASEVGDESAPATFDLDDDAAVASWQVAVVPPFNTFDAQRVLSAPTTAARLQLLDGLVDDLEQVLTFRLQRP